MALLGLTGDEVLGGGRLDLPRQVEVLGDEGRLGLPCAERLRDACVGQPPHVEHLGLVGRVTHEGVPEAVGASGLVARLDDPLGGEDGELFVDEVRVPDDSGDRVGVEGRSDRRGSLRPAGRLEAP